MMTAKTSISALIFVLVSTNLCSAIVKQYITFYPVNFCGGPHQYTFESIENVPDTSMANTLAFNGRGLWIIKKYLKSAPETEISEVYLFWLRCAILTQDYGLKSVERVLDADLEISSAVMFSGPQHYGGNRTFCKKEECNFETIIPVKSAVFTGTKGWTLFSDFDFKGTLHCLKGSSDSSKEHGMYGYPNVNFNMGSIRLGCD